MASRLVAGCTVALAIALIVGCSPEPEIVPLKQSKQHATSPTLQQPPAPKKKVDQKLPPEPNRVKATAGVGKKGRDYGTGPIATPVAAYFSAKERLVFDVQVAHAMKIYRATHGHGPRTQEEFMKNVVKRNMIKLPELPEGDRYFYDPESQELMVEKSQ